MWQAFLPDLVQERIEMTTRSGYYGELDDSTERRFIAWQDSLELFNDSPIIGVGFGVFSQMGLDWPHA